MVYRPTAKTLSVISLIVSIFAVAFTGLTWWDQHRTAEAQLNPNERLLLTCKFVNLRDGHPVTYDLAFSNPGNSSMTLCSAMICIAQAGTEMRLIQLLSRDIVIPPGTTQSVVLATPLALNEDSLIQTSPNRREDAFALIVLDAISVEGNQFRFTAATSIPDGSWDIPRILGLQVNAVPFERTEPTWKEFLTTIPPTR